MPRVRAALVDSLAVLAISRLVVLAVLVPGSGRVLGPHGYVYAWDASYYRLIAVHGYSSGVPAIDAVTPAFFPLLPMLEWLGGEVGGSPAVWGAIASSICSVAALALLHVVTAERLGPRVARLAVAAVALSPFSYVLTTGYTEGPFLLLSLLAYVATLRGRAATGGLAAFLAGLSRPSGAFLAPALLWDGWRHPERRRACVVAAIGAAAGALVYFAWLDHVQGDFLASLHAQHRVWGRGFDPLTAPAHLVRYAWGAVVTPSGSRLVYLVAIPFCAAGLLILWRAGVRDGPLVLAVLVVIVPLSTGSAQSLPRFAMATFPFAWAAGIGLERLSRRRQLVLAVLSLAALGGCVWATYWRSRLAP